MVIDGKCLELALEPQNEKAGQIARVEGDKTSRPAASLLVMVIIYRAPYSTSSISCLIGVVCAVQPSTRQTRD